MIGTLKKLVFSSTSKDSGYLFGGMIVSNLINFILIVILTNNLSSYSLGLFLTALTFAQLIIDLSDLGINSSLINFSASSSEKLNYLKASFFLKLGIALIVSIFLFISAPFVSQRLFNNLELNWLIRISTVLIFSMILINWSQAYLQSQKKFLTAAIINTSPNVLRLVIFVVLLVLNKINVISSFSAFCLVLIISLFQMFYFLKLSFLKIRTSTEDYSRLVKFGLPIGLSFAVAAIYTRLDQLLIFNIKGGEEAGIYGLALRVSLFFVLAATALNLAIAPRIATIEKVKFKSYFSKSLIASFILSLVSILSAVVAPLVWNFVFPKNQLLSVGIYQILALGTACFILSAPFFSAVLYKFKKNKFGFISSFLSLVLVWFLLENLIPIMGSKGAAISVSLVYLFQLVLAASFFYYLCLKNNES